MNGEGWPLTATYRDGQAHNARANITNLSADLGATANYNPSRFTWLNLKTTLGTQYNNYRQDQNSASAERRCRRAPSTASAGRDAWLDRKSYTIRRRGAFSSRKARRFAIACS